MKRRSHMTDMNVVFSLVCVEVEFILSAQTLECKNNLGVQS